MVLGIKWQSLSETHYPLVIAGARQWVTRTEGREGETESKRERERETDSDGDKTREKHTVKEKESGTKRERWAYK